MSTRITRSRNTCRSRVIVDESLDSAQNYRVDSVLVEVGSCSLPGSAYRS